LSEQFGLGWNAPRTLQGIILYFAAAICSGESNLRMHNLSDVAESHYPLLLQLQMRIQNKFKEKLPVDFAAELFEFSLQDIVGIKSLRFKMQQRAKFKYFR
jgi:hypothetical protein